MQIFKDLVDITLLKKFKNQLPNPKVRYVQCDGDHDELKIQAALDAVHIGGTVYVCGNCVLTNETTTQESHLLINYSTAVLKVDVLTTLDFSNCSSVTFKNLNPTKMQYMFSLGDSARLKNLCLSFDRGMYTAMSVNPGVIYTKNNCIIDNCTFDGVMPLNDTTSGYTHGVFDLQQYCKWQNCEITDWVVNSNTASEKGFAASAYCDISCSSFNNIEDASSDIDYNTVIEFGAGCNIHNCYIEGYEQTGGDTPAGLVSIGGYSIFERNYIANTDRLKFEVKRNSAAFSGNEFRSCTVGTDYLIEGSKAKISDNVFHAPKLAVDGAALILNDGDTNDNRVYNVSTSVTESNPNLAVIDVYNGTAKGNTITAAAAAKTKVVPIIGSDSVVQNNTITGLDKPMTLDSTTVSTGNVVNGVKDDVITAPCATVVVAASNSRNKALADYVCTGTSDQNAIGQAIGALPSTGGKVLMLEGTYNLDYMINISGANVTIEGMGNSTQINITAQYLFGVYANGMTVKNVSINYTGDGSGNGTVGILSMNNVNNMRIENTAFNGWGCSVNILSGTGHEVRGVRISGASISNSVGVLLAGEQCTVSDCHITATTGVQIQGDYNAIHDNYFKPIDAKDGGISVIVAKNYLGNRVSGNHFIDAEYVNYGGETNTFTDNVTVTTA